MSGMFIVANHKQVLQPQKPKKTVEFPSDMESFEKPLYFWLYMCRKFDKTAATGYK